MWNIIAIHSTLDRVEGKLYNANPSWIKDRTIDLSNCSTLEEAIKMLHSIDSMTYNEFTMYADEG